MKTLLMLVVVGAVTLSAQTVTIPARVFDVGHGKFDSFDAMIADISKADVIFVGEQHDDSNTHLLERAILEAVAKRRKDVVVAMEMFERDVQDPLVHFSMGHLSEDEFLQASRPWPNYRTDYKPIVDFAIEKNWPVVASNVPRPMASEVSKLGWDALATKSDAEKKWFAADRQCPVDDDYFVRFAEAMGEHPTSGAPDAATDDARAKRAGLERFYFAQCLKDETMGESVAQAVLAAKKAPLVVHVNGAFHSDFHEGTAARAARRLPGRRIVVISILPIDRLDAVTAPDKAEQKRADYLIYTPAAK